MDGSRVRLIVLEACALHAWDALGWDSGRRWRTSDETGDDEPSERRRKMPREGGDGGTYTHS